MSCHVEFDAYLEQVRQQAGALRAAAVQAGPDAEVPTTPGWNVLRLVQHVARVHSWVLMALETDPGADAPRSPRSPEEWDEVLDYWDKRVGSLLTVLPERGADGPSWTFTGPGTASFWARRLAHETAIHRLDAEHAAFGDAVEHLVFEPEFAADGIDELLAVLMRDRPATATGTVLLHAADAGRAWLVTATAGEPPTSGPATDLAADASVVGTADSVYRAVWGRPSTAVKGGDMSVLAGLDTP
jgi:uncharacterized protein (TIGR03083 family)